MKTLKYLFLLCIVLFNINCSKIKKEQLSTLVLSQHLVYKPDLNKVDNTGKNVIFNMYLETNIEFKNISKDTIYLTDTDIQNVFFSKMQNDTFNLTSKKFKNKLMLIPNKSIGVFYISNLKINRFNYPDTLLEKEISSFDIFNRIEKKIIQKSEFYFLNSSKEFYNFENPNSINMHL